MGLVPLVTPAHIAKRRSSQVVVSSTPTSPRSPMQRARSLLAAATPEDPAVSPVSGAGSVFSVSRDELEVVTELPESPGSDGQHQHVVEQEELFSWDRWWIDNEVLPVPNGNPIDAAGGNFGAEQVLMEPRYAEVGEDNANPPPMGEAQINNGLVQNEIQGVGEIEGTPIKRNKWGDVTIAVAAVASLWFTGVLKGLAKKPM